MLLNPLGLCTSQDGEGEGAAMLERAMHERSALFDEQTVAVVPVRRSRGRHVHVLLRRAVVARSRLQLT
jgi:hypothetical protein